MSGLFGKKIGMTHIFAEDGRMIPVTVIEAGPCPVLAVKEKSIQLGFEAVVNPKRVNNSLRGYFKKLNITTHKLIGEVFMVRGKDYKIGDQLKADVFSIGEFVDVIGISRGMGFQGGMKRWNWSGQPKTHGSMSHRRVGSMGSNTTPGRVWKGHHLAGHMGNQRVTVQNLKVVKVDVTNNLLLVRGAVPGYRNSYLMIRKAIKKENKAKMQPQPKAG